MLPLACEKLKNSQGMNVLQLRRMLRAIGQPTVGLKPVLVARLDKAVSSGIVESYVQGAKSQPRDVVQCGESAARAVVLIRSASLTRVRVGQSPQRRCACARQVLCRLEVVGTPRFVLYGSPPQDEHGDKRRSWGVSPSDARVELVLIVPRTPRRNAIIGKIMKS